MLPIGSPSTYRPLGEGHVSTYDDDVPSCNGHKLLRVKEQRPKTLEPIYGIEFTQSSIKLLISSNGCTTAGSFEIRQNHAAISVVRIKGDLCR